MSRPVQVRLAEYAKAMRSTAMQMNDFVAVLETDNADTSALKDGVRLYLLFADDLDKLVAGEELKPFIVTGVI